MRSLISLIFASIYNSRASVFLWSSISSLSYKHEMAIER